MDLRTLADRLGLELRGENRAIQGVANPEEAGPDDLIFLVESEYLPRIQASAALAFVGKGADRLEGKSQLVAENPRLAMARILAFFAHPAPRGIHPASVVDPSATLGEGVSVGAHAFVGPGCTIGRGTVLHPNVTVLDEAIIGEDCVLYPGVTVREGCRLGDRVLLQPGCVIGSDGYGFLLHEGKHEKIPQIGNVVVEDDVEIGANTAIDRATIGSTRIGQGTKIDNLVHIAHNDRIGEHCLIVSQTGISGSVTVGARTTLAGQVGVAGHLSIGEDCLVLARSGITKDLPSRSMVSGFPAKPHREELKRAALPARMERKLEELQQALSLLEEKFARLEHSEGQPRLK